MRQFGKILSFELKYYLKNKVFVGVTVFLVLAIGIVMSLPRFSGIFDFGTGTDSSEDRSVMLIQAETPEQARMIQKIFSAAFTDYDVAITRDHTDTIKQQIMSGNAACAFVMNGMTSYTYYVDNLSMYDSNSQIADELLQNLYRMNAMITEGMTPEQADQVMGIQITGEVENLGKDQMQNFFYTYIMIFALYMVILLYGQMVASNVASEKSSRAMEVLITSAKPISMMFGKVIASCLAGLIQLIAVFGSALAFYRLNQSCWGDNPIVNSIFAVPPALLGYMLTFFILGFFIYAFLYGAIGSTASKLEDINTSVMPITMLFLISFFVVIFSFASGNIDNMVIKVCSFIPFTSPMAMFTRIAMSTVPWHEIVISIALLAASVVGVGVISAKIYRVGVLLYGTPPKIGAILKAIKKA